MALAIRITGPQLIELRDIISEVLTFDDLNEFLLGQLDVNLANIVLLDGDIGMPAVSLAVVRHFNNRNAILNLAHQLRLVRPRNPDIVAFIKSLGGNAMLPSGSPTLSNLEAFLTANAMVDVRTWTSCLATLQNQVCRVEVSLPSGMRYGTGFLISADRVITNYHVVSDVAGCGQIQLRFDHATLSHLALPYSGKVYGLRSDWLVDASPPGEADISGGQPATDELDFALLQVDGRPGEERVAAEVNQMTAFEPRGFVELPSSVSPLGHAMYILQHTQGREMKLAIETQAEFAFNANQTRIWYRTNTDHGSSGSPCFNADWQLIAMHQGRDLGTTPGHQPKFNQGIPIVKIVDQLRGRGHL